ncbi:MAG: YitT family protein [Clostridia bacterium]|nr:YitT family protein [Clostridia bacterium]
MEEKNQSAEVSETNYPPLPPKITRENFQTEATSTKSKVFYWIKTVIGLLISTFLVSFAAKCLLVPNEFTVGGAAGIGILLNAAFGIPQSIIVFCINAPLVILSYFFVKKKFAILTSAHIILQSVWLAFFENVCPDFVIEFASNGEKIYAAIATAICMGVAIGLAFKMGGSTGGADIVAVMIQRKFAATSIAWMLFILNCVVIGSSIFVFQGETPALTLLPIMMSVLESYVESLVNEAVTKGFQSAIEYRIITDKPEEMSLAIMQELSRGVTAIPAKGMYTKEDHTMIMCVISRRQSPVLKKLMKRVDPDAFAVMANVSQVVGLGFYTGDIV